MSGLRLSRLAAAIGIVVAIAFGSTAANAVSIANFTSSADGFALRLTTDMSGLPQAVKDAIQSNYTTARDAAVAADPSAAAQLPAEFPFVIDQYIARTASGASNTATTASSIFGEGFRSLGSVSANQVGQSNSSQFSDPISLPNASVSVLGAEVGSILASVSNGPTVLGEATVARATISLADVAGFLPTQVAQAYDAVVAQVNSAVNQANSAVDDTTQAVSDLIAGTPLASAPVIGPIVADGVALATAINIPTLGDPLSVDVGAITGVKSSATAAREPSKASASSTSELASVNLLDGFFQTGLIKLKTHSEAGGLPGTATNSSECTLADLRIGGNTGASFDGKNLFVEVDGAPVALPVPTNEVAAIKAQVDSVLAAAGVSVDLCSSAQANAAPDGTAASQSLSAFIVTFEPKIPAGLPAQLEAELATLGLQSGDSLIKIVIDPTVSSTAGAQTSAPTLPRTGPGAIATVVAGIALAGAALIARRKLS